MHKLQRQMPTHWLLILRYKHELLIEMCFKNIYCENIYCKKTQTKNESVIVYMSDKMHLTHANIMAYQMPLLHMGEHPGHGLLVLLSLLLGGDCWNGLCWWTARLLLCHCTNPFLCSLLSLPGLMAGFGAPMHFMVCRACFTMHNLQCTFSSTQQWPPQRLDTSHRKNCPSNVQLWCG